MEIRIWLIAAAVLAAGCQTARYGQDIDAATMVNLLRKAGIRKTDVWADLGSYDGSAAVIAAKHGLPSVAYPHDVYGYMKFKQQARREGVEDKIRVEWLKRDLSLGGAHVVFYAPSRFFTESDLAAAMKGTVGAKTIISTQKLSAAFGNLSYVGEEEGLQIYRWGPQHGVRDTVPPPKDVVYPLPPKAPAAPAAPKPAAQ
jgi:hypothetical protein